MEIRGRSLVQTRGRGRTTIREPARSSDGERLMSAGHASIHDPVSGRSEDNSLTEEGASEAIYQAGIRRQGQGGESSPLLSSPLDQIPAWV